MLMFGFIVVLVMLLIMLLIMTFIAGVVVGVRVRTACIIENLTDNGWTVEPPDVSIEDDVMKH